MVIDVVQMDSDGCESSHDTTTGSTSDCRSRHHRALDFPNRDQWLRICYRYKDSLVVSIARNHLEMNAEFPGAVPEIPVGDIDTALKYYASRLGFTIDWGQGGGGIAGISKGHCRMFLTNAAFRSTMATLVRC